MKLTVFGGTGRVGTQIIQQAVEDGHDVTAVVRDPSRLEADVRAVVTDLSAPDPAKLKGAVDGADAVLSGLGPQKKAETGIASKGTRAIAEAMTAAGVRRLLVISGIGVDTVPTVERPNPPRREPGTGLVMQYLTTPLTRAVLGPHMVDVALMEEHLRGTDLDWTVMRMPYVVDKPLTGVYRTAYGKSLRGAFRIGRADAARQMLQMIREREAVRTVVTIAY
jgi:uncharacterized protein YbjT (DUF2867 family)